MLQVIFSPEKLARTFSLKKVETFPDRKMIKLLTGFHGYQGFSRQNDAGSLEEIHLIKSLTTLHGSIITSGRERVNKMV